MNISWFPGHMKKAERFVKEYLPLVDSVLIVLDARIPESSRNGVLEKLIGEKPLIFVLNKTDLAEKQATTRRLSFFASCGLEACALSTKSGKGFESLRSSLERARREVCERRRAKGRREEVIRSMVLGVPNVGKSSIINRLGKKNAARVGKNPGVTRSFQWIRATPLVELLDFPGIFYPRPRSVEQGLRCASLGIVKEEILPLEDVALFILTLLESRHHPLIKELALVSLSPMEKLQAVGRRYGFLGSDHRIDIQRTALYVIRNFREGAYGVFTLELPGAAEASGSLPVIQA